MAYDVRLHLKFSPGFRDFKVELTVPDGRTASIAGPLPAEEPASYLLRGDVLTLLEDALSGKPPEEFGRILFVSDFPDTRIPWESILHAPPLAGAGFVFVFWSETPSPLSGTAPQLPIQCLTAGIGIQRSFDIGDTLGGLIPDPEINLPRTFRVIELNGSDGNVTALALSRQFDIVHLLVGPAGSFNQSDFLRIVRESKCRLLIVHIQNAADPKREAGLFSESLRNAALDGLPAVILTAGPPRAAEYFYFRLYEAIVHDSPIDLAFQRAYVDARPVWSDMVARLFLSPGSENLLRLSAVAQRLEADTEDEILRVQALRADRSIPIDEAFAFTSRLENVLESIHSLRWDSESRGLTPLAGAADRLKANRWSPTRDVPARSLMGAVVPEPNEARVANVAFLGSTGIVPGYKALWPSTRYNFRVQIGRRLPESIVANPVPVPEAQLEPFMERDGLRLRVVLSSREFEILDPEQELVLPPSGPSKMIHLRLRTPPSEDPLQLRAAIYYENNLLQSIRVTADTNGNRAEVEYCICGTMRNVDMYPPRSLNLLLNESHDGTHTFAVAGTGIREDFTFTEGEMRNALRETRRTLLEICARLDGNGNPVEYRFDSETNRGTRAQFEKDIKKLAYSGRDLYAVFVTNKSSAFAKKLRASLIQKSQIQVAAMRSAKYVFPWALVYDKLLVQDESNEICPDFLSDVGASRGFRCLSSSGCPNANDANVICPSGFWGYRHVIEQPPSIAREDTTPDRDLPVHLDVTGDPKLMMAVSLELAHSDKHYKELKRVRPYRVDLARDKKATVDALLGQPAPNLVYFYCHGGKQNGKAFLGIGKDQRLLTGDLVGCGLEWPDTHPLVFINGCRTAELSPDDLLTFVTTFSWCQAAGVIGSEISITEDLAREFALQFFQAMLEPAASVGEVIRRERLQLLEKYNLLGLAYTVFCHSSLRFRNRR